MKKIILGILLGSLVLAAEEAVNDVNVVKQQKIV